VYVYLVNEYVDEDAVVVENAEKGLSVELELELELRLKLSWELRNLLEAVGEVDDVVRVEDAEGDLKAELKLEPELLLELLIELIEAKMEVAGTGVTKMIEVMVATISTDSVEDEWSGVEDEVSSVDTRTVEDRVKLDGKRVEVDEVDVRLLDLSSSSRRELSFASAPIDNKEKMIWESRKRMMRVVLKTFGGCFSLAIHAALSIVRVAGWSGWAAFLDF
jgi:hypothetical protein